MLLLLLFIPTCLFGFRVSGPARLSPWMLLTLPAAWSLHVTGCALRCKACNSSCHDGLTPGNPVTHKGNRTIGPLCRKEEPALRRCLNCDSAFIMEGVNQCYNDYSRPVESPKDRERSALFCICIRLFVNKFLLYTVLSAEIV